MEFNPIQMCFDIWTRQGHSAFKFKEFREEFSKFVFVSRILRNYKNKDVLNTRLLLNHVIVLYNIFGPTITPIFFLVSEEDVWSELHAVLLFLNHIPVEKRIKIDDWDVDLTKFPPNDEVMSILNAL